MSNLTTQAEEYYTLIGEKKVAEIAHYLDPDVELYSPLATVKGKEAVYETVSNFIHAIESLTIRAKFGNKNQAIIVYEVDMPGVSKNFPGASLLTFKDNLIARFDLFYDGELASKKKEDIFS